MATWFLFPQSSYYLNLRNSCIILLNLCNRFMMQTYNVSQLPAVIVFHSQGRLQHYQLCYLTRSIPICCFHYVFKPTRGDKSVETLGSKIQVLSVLVTFPPFPPKQCLFFYFFHCTDHSTYTTLNWGAGGTRELTLDANKIEQILKY